MRLPLPIRWISLAAACVLALPLPLGVWGGLYLRLSPLLFLQSVLTRTPLVPLAALGGLALALIFWRNRWFCRSLCPTGALCDAVSSWRKPNNLWQRLPRVHRFLALAGLGLAALGFPVLGILDPIALFQSAWSPLYFGFTFAAGLGIVGLAGALLVSLWFPFVWCRRLCPLGGLQELATALREQLRRKSRPGTDKSSPGAGWQRRDVLTLGLGMAGGWLLGRLGAPRAQAALRPPGAQPEGRFLATCCRCGNCTRACPTHIIAPATDLAAPLGLLAPRLGFSQGYCLPSCNVCGQVCPTGAIPPFPVKEKPRLIIGTAGIRLDDCLLTQGSECDRCKTACPYEAVTISGDLFTSVPSIVKEHCTGCGACVASCPPQVITVVR